MTTIWGFDNMKNKHTLYRGEGCIKAFYESLKEHVKKKIDFEKNNILPLTKKNLNYIKMQKYVIFVEKAS